MKKVGKLLSNIVSTLVILSGAMILTYGFSVFGVKGFVAMGIEWISASDLGLMIIGLGIMLWVAVSNKITNRYWDRYYDDWVKSNDNVE